MKKEPLLDASRHPRPVPEPGPQCSFSGSRGTAPAGPARAPFALRPHHHGESALLACCSGRPPSGRLMVVVDGNKQAEALSEADRNILRPAGHVRYSAAAADSRARRASGAAPLAAHRNREQRAIGLWRLATGACRSRSRRSRPRCCAPKPPEFYRQLALTLRVGEEIPLEDLIAHLESIGYERREPVEMVGRVFAARRHSRHLSRRERRSRSASSCSAT